MSVENVLFVCTGNTCRSIMAEAYLRQRARDEGLGMRVRSAGTLAVEGASPSELAGQVLQRTGVSTTDLSSSSLTKELVEWADIVLVMEPAHRERVLELVPGSAEKVFCLARWAGVPGGAIPDPMGSGEEAYERAFRTIKDSIEGFLSWLQEQ